MTSLARGYCQDKDQIALLRILGLAPKHIYCAAVPGETIAACVSSFRGCRGTLYVAAILERHLRYGDITVMGFTAAAFESLTDFIAEIRKLKMLQRTFAALH